MDALDEILASLRLSGGVVFDAVLRGDWCAMSKTGPRDCAPFFPIPSQVISYHYVRSGKLYSGLPDQPMVELGPGDLVLYPRNDAHLIAGAPGLVPQDLSSFASTGLEGSPHIIRMPGDGSETALFCGWLGVTSGRHPLLETLPSVMVAGSGSTQARRLTELSLDHAATELQNDAFLVARLSEVLFGRAVRQFVEGLGSDLSGWLAGLQDPVIARALAIIHAADSSDLNLNDLARSVGVSRSVLGERFAAALGEAPMRYWSRWRLRRAADLLQDTATPVSSIAFAIGFASEAAFSRAFKREFGKSPSAWRQAPTSAALL